MAGRGVLCSGSIIYDTLVQPSNSPWGTTSSWIRSSRTPAAMGPILRWLWRRSASPVRLIGAVGGDDPAGSCWMRSAARAWTPRRRLTETPTAATIALVNQRRQPQISPPSGRQRGRFREGIDFTPELVEGHAATTTSPASSSCRTARQAVATLEPRARSRAHSPLRYQLGPARAVDGGHRALSPPPRFRVFERRRGPHGHRHGRALRGRPLCSTGGARTALSNSGRGAAPSSPATRIPLPGLSGGSEGHHRRRRHLRRRLSRRLVAKARILRKRAGSPMPPEPSMCSRSAARRSIPSYAGDPEPGMARRNRPIEPPG